MKNDTKRFFIIGAVVVVAFIGMRVLKKRHAPAVEDFKNPGARSTVPAQNTAHVPGTDATSMSQKNTQPLVQGKWAPDPQHPGIVINPRSEASKKEFLAVSHLNIKLPSDYAYQKIDISENVTGIKGTDEHHKVKFAILARRGTANPNDVAGFLSDQGNLVPGFEGGAAVTNQMGSGHELTPKEDSGLEQVRYWEIKHGDEVTRVVFANRKDGQGSYLFVVDGNSHKIDAQEGRFEDILDKTKAQ